VAVDVGLVCPPAYLWVPEYAETDGDLAADLAAWPPPPNIRHVRSF